MISKLLRSLPAEREGVKRRAGKGIWIVLLQLLLTCTYV